MDLIQTVILAIVQGITEFLPISSSAHLIVVPRITGWTDQGLVIDVALHLGSLAAVMLYFRQDTASMIRGGVKLLTGDASSVDARLALHVGLATIPVVIVGFLIKDLVANEARNVLLIASTTICFGLLLWLADRGGNEADRSDFERMTLKAALLIGMAQTIALIPGVSRSGITMTTALFLGFRREAAARFSMLLSIPTTAAACVLIGVDVWRSGDAALQLDAIIAAVFAFAAALAAIAGLMAWLRRATFTPFVVYRLLLGCALLFWFV
jgi:undecaprenyl-diphosphatase